MRTPFCIAGAMLSCLLNIAPALAQSDAPVTYYHDAGSKWPFSPAVRVGDVIYLSGQVGFDANGHLPDGMEAQARAAMNNVAATAKRAGVGMDNVFKCTVMLSDMKQWPTFNKIYVEYFKPDRLPARTAFGANGLALGALLEIDCMAAASAK